MVDSADIPTWIALLMGIYSLGAAIGELRNPGSWAAMLENFEQSAATSFLTGIVLIAIGGAIYLGTPAWETLDWLGILVKVTGGGMVLEGFVVLGFAHTFLTFASKLLGAVNRIWAFFAAVIGIVLICVAIMRL